ncbi:hypothetical protein BJX70DRAFT_136258 [Aspergillus crustosus]
MWTLVPVASTHLVVLLNLTILIPVPFRLRSGSGAREAESARLGTQSGLWMQCRSDCAARTWVLCCTYLFCAWPQVSNLRAPFLCSPLGAVACFCFRRIQNLICEPLRYYKALLAH